MSGIDTFLLTPDEAETSCISALQNGYRLIDTATDTFRADTELQLKSLRQYRTEKGAKNRRV